MGIKYLKAAVAVQSKTLTSPVSFFQQVCRKFLQEILKKVDKLYYSLSIQLKRVLVICDECLFHEFVHCPLEGY